MADALGMLDRALAVLANADAASLPTESQAQALRGLERAESRLTAARARLTAAFTARGGPEEDGHGSARTWLRWQTRITRAAAAGAVGWARRLAAHPVIGEALAGGELSGSWARQICGWTDRLPADLRQDGDEILTGAAAGGAELADLAGLAEEMIQRCGSNRDEDGFEDRYFRLTQTIGGAGRAEGDLTPGCAAALGAVLEALGKKAGPEDVRSAGQRRHDALEEACRRLIAAGMVPGRAGQPTHIQVHLTLSQLRDLPGAAEAEHEWAAARAGEPGWLTGPEADAAACDATIIPVVTGRPDPSALGRLTETFLTGANPAGHDDRGHGFGGCQDGRSGPGGGGPRGRPGSDGGQDGDGSAGSDGSQDGNGSNDGAPGPRPLPVASRRRLRRALLALAADALSGPGGLAAWLRTGLLRGGELASPSLPLDIGAATEIIPAHLRRAVTTRHPGCAFPGCDTPASACQVHHIVPRAAGGLTALPNLLPACTFHHLVAIHRWGWQLTLNPDGTSTATSPDGTRTRRSHSPPANAA